MTTSPRDIMERAALNALEKTSPLPSPRKKRLSANTSPEKRLSRSPINGRMRHSQSMVVQQNGHGGTDENYNSSGQIQQHNTMDSSNRPTVMHSVKQKLNNIGHYTNMLGFGAFFGGRSNSGSRSRSNSRTRTCGRQRQSRRNSDDNFLNDRYSDDEDYVFVESIELYQFDGFNMGQKEVGRGHNFRLTQLTTSTWCDKCGDFIWGAYKQCLRCKYCKFTCHHKCRPSVTLDCPRTLNTSQQQQEESVEAVSGEKDDSDSGYHTGNSTLVGRGGVGISKPKGEYTLTREELRKNIEKFNNNAHGLIMNIESDSNMFEGFIRVHMNLIRPINMSLTARPPSIYEVLAHEEPEPESPVDTNTQIASFYLPKDTTKVIHIQSNTSTQEVIKALLTKFRITDNPRKFALYDKYEEPGQKPIMRKLVDDEMPLPLCLSWRAEAEDGLDTHRFILQENDAGEILWDAFSIPELENFVRMLDREEQEYLDQVRAKYKLMKIHMDRRMNEIQEAEQKQREQQSTETQAETDSKEESNQDKEDKREPVFV